MTDGAFIIDGKAFAAALRSHIADDVALLKERHGLTPGLAVVLVGEDPASQIYVRNKIKQTEEAGMLSQNFCMSADSTHAEVLDQVRALNKAAEIHGILVQLPLPPQVDEARIIAEINPDKDVDGFHVINAGRLATGQDGMVPCTPLGCVMMLKDRLGDLGGLHAVVVGRSNIVGKPIAQLLLKENCTVTVCHSRTRDLPAECGRADILIAAVGQPEMIRGDWIKPGATVIDVGINRISVDGGDKSKTRLVGDVCFAEAVTVAGAITPVPGGVGPMTIACLLQNTVTAACRQAGIEI